MKAKIWGEVVIVIAAVFALLIVAKVFSGYLAGGAQGNLYSAIYLILFIYVPLIMLRIKKRPCYFINRGVAGIMKDIRLYLVWSLIIFPAFFAVAAVWIHFFYGAPSFHMAAFPALSVIATQILVVGFPEEIFFRGYVQTTLNTLYPKKWQIFGASLGPAWIITAALFALCHSLITVQWWHFAIFFPALLFGYLREKSGVLLPSILFHATSNLVLSWIVASFN